MGHISCTKLLNELSKSFLSKEYAELSKKDERIVIDALIGIGVVAKSDAEVYFSYSRSVKDLQAKVLKLTSHKTFSDVLSNITKLKGMMPTNDFSLLVYVVILCRLIHTNLGRMALFTPMRVYSEYLEEIDVSLSELHNELVKSRMNSEFFKSFKGLFYGMLTIFAYFPLCRYLGENYSVFKYSVNCRDPKEKANEFDMTGLFENDDYFALISTDLRNAFTNIQSWNKFFRRYAVGQ